MEQERLEDLYCKCGNRFKNQLDEELNMCEDCR